MANQSPSGHRADHLRLSKPQTPPLPTHNPKAAEAHAAPQPAGASSSRGPLIPVTAWNERHAWPPLGGLRHLIFHASTNGFDAVIRRVGRRVLIDEAAFFTWVNSNGGAK